MSTITINNGNIAYHKKVASVILDGAFCRTTGLDKTSGYMVYEIPYTQGMQISMRVNGDSCAGITYWDRLHDTVPTELETNGFLGYDNNGMGASSEVTVSNYTPTNVPEGTAYVYLAFMKTKKKFVKIG